MMRNIDEMIIEVVGNDKCKRQQKSLHMKCCWLKSYSWKWSKEICSPDDNKKKRSTSQYSKMIQFIQSRKRFETRRWKRRKMWNLVITVLIVLYSLWRFIDFVFGKKLTRLKLGLVSTYDFAFRMKSEDRMIALRKIHLVFPRFLHVDFLWFKVLLVYDPEIFRRLKKYFHINKKN